MRVLKVFHGNCVFKPISSLSFWERARVRAASSLGKPYQGKGKTRKGASKGCRGETCGSGLAREYGGPGNDDAGCADTIASRLTPGIVRTAKRRDHLTSIIRSQIKRIATCRAIHEVLGFGT